MYLNQCQEKLHLLHFYHLHCFHRHRSSKFSGLCVCVVVAVLEVWQTRFRVANFLTASCSCALTAAWIWPISWHGETCSRLLSAACRSTCKGYRYRLGEKLAALLFYLEMFVATLCFCFCLSVSPDGFLELIPKIASSECQMSICGIKMLLKRETAAFFFYANSALSKFQPPSGLMLYF